MIKSGVLIPWALFPQMFLHSIRPPDFRLLWEIILTQECVADVFGNLIAGFRLGEMAEFFVEHPLELEKKRKKDE
jgi:hypothetical protein